MVEKRVPEKVEVPKDQPKVAQAAAPVASLSSHSDPYPHYIASALCGGTALYARSAGWNSKAVAVATGFALSYFSAGRMVASGTEKLGYDLGTITSLGLMSWMVPVFGKLIDNVQSLVQKQYVNEDTGHGYLGSWRKLPRKFMFPSLVPVFACDSYLLVRNTPSTILATVGSMSAVANGIKSYEVRTGLPKEVVEK